MRLRMRAGFPSEVWIVIVLAAGCAKEAPPPVKPAPAAEKAWTPLVDGNAVLKRVRSLVSWGPRPSGSEGIEYARADIRAQLAEIGIGPAQVREQRFTEKTPSPPTPGETEFVNIVATIPGRRPGGVALAAHYDSKLLPAFRFVGANDAASAVGLVLEIGRVLAARAAAQTPDWSTYLVFLDGEEAFVDWHQGNDHTYGSRYMASKKKEMPFQALILLDMVGTKDIVLADDRNSSPELRRIFKAVSSRVFGWEMFSREFPVTDDHLEFRDVGGIPVIDLIDHTFEQSSWWHQPGDVVEILDPRALERVGTLVLTALPEVEAACAR